MQRSHKQEQLRRGALLRRAVLAGVSLPLAALPALAQDATNAVTQTPAMVVTGTRITSAEAEGALSVTTLDTAQPINKGFPTVADTLRNKLPQYGGTGIVNEGYANGGDGSSVISLRSLPTSATLVLVNGRRTSTSDLNMIPEAAIDRIEILNDGASAIYGSDAVAGVVNIILKEGYNGVKLDAYYGNTFDSDIGQRKWMALFGHSTDKTSYTMSLEYTAANSMLSVDRERSRPLPDAVSGTSNPGLFVGRGVPAGQTPLRWHVVPGATTGLTSKDQLPAGFDPLATVDTTGLSTSAANAKRNAEEGRLNALLGPNSPVQYGNNPSLGPGLAGGFPYGLYTVVYRPHEKYSGYSAISHKLFDEHLEVFANFYYTRNTSMNQLAPSPLSGRVVPASNYWYNQIFPTAAATGRSMTVGYRPVELGPRVTDTDFESFHGVTGLKGKIGTSSWNWELAFLWDRVTIDDTQTGGVKADEYNRLLGLSTPDAWNPFGYTPIGGSSKVNSSATVNSLGASATTREVVSTQGLDFRIGGDTAELPGGPLAVSFGGELRREKDDYQPDFAIRNGLVFPFNIQQALVAQRDVNSLYGEVLVPITKPDMEIPGFTSLSFDVAARYEDYSDVGDTGIKPRVSFRWQPVGKQLTLRGSYAQGFIAPGFASLYQEPGQDFLELFNPVTGERKQPEEAVLTVGNKALKPSQSESWLTGFLYSPECLKGFSAGANYYRIEQSKIPFQSAQYIVNQWFAAGGADNPANPWGAAAAASAANPTGAQVELTSTGDLFQVRNVGSINSGVRLTDGIDLLASQEINTSVGKFTLSGQATRVLTFKQENFPGAGSVNYLGKFWATGAALEETGFPEWRANLTLNYEFQRFIGAIGWNYTDGYTEDVSGTNFETADTELRKIRSYQTFDLRVGYKIPKVEVDVLFGINNVFDERPAQVTSTFGDGYDRSLADIRGRMYWVSLSKKF